MRLLTLERLLEQGCTELAMSLGKRVYAEEVHTGALVMRSKGCRPGIT